MKLKPIGSNQTELTTPSGIRVLFSYSTPVAAELKDYFVRTETYYSSTTTKHINEWLNEHVAI
jgi:hypothetical protein